MKDNKAKRKVAAKVANGKAKIKAKLGKAAKACVLVALLMAVAGCAMSEPASRATTARYGDIVARVESSTNVTINITLGDGALASADSAGSTETTTSTPTTDIKPDIDVSVPVNKAGSAQSVGSVLGDAVASLITGASKKTSDTAASATSAASACADGSCTVQGACTDGSCSE